MNASRVDSDSSRHTGWMQGLLPAAALRVCPGTPRPHQPVSETQERLWMLTAGSAKSCYRSFFLVWRFFVLNVLKNCFQVWLKHLFPCSPSQGDSLPVCLVCHFTVVDLGREVLRHVPGQPRSEGAMAV